MMAIMGKYGLPLTLTALAVAVAGCGGSPGTPTPQSTGGGATTTSATGKPNPTGTTGSPSGNITAEQLCGLLSAQDAQALSIDPSGKPDHLGADQECKWRGAQVGMTLFYSTKGSVKDLHFQSNEMLSDAQIAGRPGKISKISGPPARCASFVDVGPKSYLSVTADLRSGEDNPSNCDTAKRALELAMTKFPG
jgi:hypothetical protein